MREAAGGGGLSSNAERLRGFGGWGSRPTWLLGCQPHGSNAIEHLVIIGRSARCTVVKPAGPFRCSGQRVASERDAECNSERTGKTI